MRTAGSERKLRDAACGPYAMTSTINDTIGAADPPFHQVIDGQRPAAVAMSSHTASRQWEGPCFYEATNEITWSQRREPKIN